jgi:LAO/AO transport system kinase
MTYRNKDSSVPDQVFIDKILAKDRPSIARAISIAEAGGDSATSLSNAIHAHIGRAYRVGITGPPGAGKSTITTQLAKYARQQGASVAIVAVDPSSPLTNGATECAWMKSKMMMRSLFAVWRHGV